MSLPERYELCQLYLRPVRLARVYRTERDLSSHSLSHDARDDSTERYDAGSKRGRTKERSTLERVTEVLGLESEDEDDVGEGWKEFRKGQCASLLFDTCLEGSCKEILF